MMKRLAINLVLAITVLQPGASLAISQDDLNAVINDTTNYIANDQDLPDCNSTTGSSIALPADMTLDQKIAQTFIVGFDAATPKTTIQSLFKKYRLGGMYLTGTKSAATAGFGASFYTQLGTDAHVPIVASSDEEGGLVHRYAYPAGSFPAPADMGSNAQKIGADAGTAMKGFGLTADLAPVLDLRDVGTGLVGRSFSSDPGTVASQAGAFTTGLVSSGITPIFKHFPGFDSTTSGSTDNVKVVMTGPIANTTAPYKTLTAKFPNAGVMMSNMYVNTLDSGNPTSLSAASVTYLRSTIGFQGMITTDDLAVASVTAATGGLPASVAKSLQAGVTMPLFASPSDAGIQAVIDKVKATVTPAMIDAADAKIITFKNGQTAASPGTSTGTTSGARNNAEAAFKFLTSKGANPAQAAGAVGNMIEESGGVEPQRAQYGTFNGHTFAGGNKTPAATIESDGLLDWPKFGWGIIQWTPPRQAIDGMKGMNIDPNILSSQLSFMWKTFDKGGVWNYRWTGFLADSANASIADPGTGTTPPELAASSWRQHVEIGSASPSRQANALAVYNWLVNGTPLPPNLEASIAKGGDAITSSNCASSTSPTGDISAYKNPFRDVKQLSASRVDQGVDYVGTGPVYPLGNGKIVDFKPDHWSDVTNPDVYINYQLSDGPAAGKYVYQAEACALRPGYAVGSLVDVNKPLCDMNPSSIEIGWSSDPKQGHIALSHAEYLSAPSCAGNGYVTNAGQDFAKLLVKLGAPAGTHQAGCGVSTAPMPAGWPQW